MGLIIILLAICIVSTSAGLLPEEILLRNSIPNCKDGKGPLLAADHVYSCKEGCPEGFVCEYQDEIKRLEKGICCPDLDILYRLYGNDDEAQEQQIGQTKTNRSDISFLISAQSDHQQSNSKREMFEINEVSNRRQNASAFDGEHTVEFDCKRKSYKSNCVNSNRSPQAVIRWFVRKGICRSYIYSYCGENVISDRTIRTKKECKALCVKSAESVDKVSKKAAVHSVSARWDDLQTTVRDRLEYKQIEPNVTKRNVMTNNLYDHKHTKRTDVEMLSAFTFKCNEASKETEIGNHNRHNDYHQTKQTEYTCELEPFRSRCGSFRSQYTLRWYANDGICRTYPHGYCHDDDVLKKRVLKTKSDCEWFCLGRSDGEIEIGVVLYTKATVISSIPTRIEATDNHAHA